MRGFTLLETLLYIALLGFLLTSAVSVAYTLSRNADRFSVNTTAHDEGNFVLRKVDWALGDLKTVSSPSSGYGSSLTIIRNDGTQVDFRLSGGVVEMREGGTGAYTPITTANVTVTSLGFQTFTGATPGIEASTTINGVTFMTRRYSFK